MTVRSFLVACIAVVGFAGVAQADTPQQEMPAADAEKWMTFFDKLVTTVADSVTCEKMATNVNAVVEANRDAIEIARAAKQRGTKLPADMQTRMVEGVKKMVPGMQRCGHDHKVRAAFAKLDLNRKG